jgi:PAS domain S-box-containing protein
MGININFLLLTFTAGINLWIGMYVCRRSANVEQARAFTLMAFAISVWSMAIALTVYDRVEHTLALRFAFGAASLIPLGVLGFVEHLPVRVVGCSTVRRWLFTPLAAVMCLVSFSSWIVVSMKAESKGANVEYGFVHPFFALYMIFCFGYSLYVLRVKYRRASGQLRSQVRYLLLAFTVPSGLATITNLGAPLLLNTSAFSMYGPLFSLLVLALIGHAIIRHRLMDMRVVIKRSVVYLAAFAVAGLILIVLLLASDIMYQDPHRIPMREILLALVVAVFFTPLKNQIRRAFDRYLYREPYDYQRTIRDASRALADTIDLPTLVTFIANLVTTTLKAESAAIYLFDEDERRFEKVVEVGETITAATLPLSSALMEKVINDRDTAFRDEVAGAGETGGGLLEMEFERFGAEVVVPLIEEEQVIGLLCLGPKRSGDPYYRDDADLLSTLANQAAVAIRNAQAHQWVVRMNEELQKILGTIGSGVIAVGPRGKISLFNRAAEELTGVAAHTAVGRTVERLPPPLAQLIAATTEDGQSRPQVELSLPDATGRLLPLVCSTSPLLGPQGTTTGAVAVIADLSHLKELEQEKRRAERLASLEAITSGVVHEIRNPLVAIKTFSQLLPIRFGDEDFRDTFSRVAEREMRRIEDLLTRLRTLSSASSQPLESVNVSAPLQDTLETLRPMLEERGIRLRERVDGTPHLVLGNASQLEQLFLNVCLNAIEAMPSGGELAVRVEEEISEGGDGKLRVEISDTGCGIPEELLATIFNPFFTTKAHGTGLGLAICRSIADSHHARLSASSTMGRPGSTFVIEFPVAVGGGARVTT